jgi:arylsulfatase
MFSIMDFLPTLASIVGGTMPTDRPIDGVDQSELLFGKSAVGHRESLLSFIGPELVAVRWKLFRLYLTDMHSTGEGPQRIAGLASADAPMAGYPRVYNVESDPHEDLNVGAFNGWVAGQYIKAVVEYERSVKEHPNPPAPNVTRFMTGG